MTDIVTMFAFMISNYVRGSRVWVDYSRDKERGSFSLGQSRSRKMFRKVLICLAVALAVAHGARKSYSG